ncbi:MAG TPA: ABC transporter permease, partial [Myxococcales bacterium]|nr:ABC transporter permease [Myxococcales bacterium]
MDSLLADLKFSFRMLRKSPSVTAVAILTLAIALGATTAIFSAVSAMLLRPLPFPRAHELVAMQDIEPAQGKDGEHGFSWPEFTDMRAQAPDIAGLAAYRQESFNLTGRGEPSVIDALLVSDGFFHVLEVPPLAGRFFSAGEHVPNAAALVVASESFWHRALGGVQPGSTVMLDGEPFQLIGVAPDATTAVAPADVYLSMERKLRYSDRGTHWLETVGRLKPGVTLARAQQDLKLAAPRIAEAAKATHLASIHDLRQFLKGDAAPLLWLLLAAVGLVLLIAAVNLANVVLARASARLRE